MRGWGVMSAHLNWDRDGFDWPQRKASRIVTAAGFDWRVVTCGQGPALLMLHGTGASAHSFRDLIPLLEHRFSIIAPDLPGHGFSADPPAEALSLPGMAKAVAGLLDRLEVDPEIVIGHSAGSAVLAKMVLDGLIAPRTIVSINGALLPFHAMTGPVFSALAKMLAFNPVVPWMFAFQAANGRLVDRLLSETGSTIDERGAELYRRLTSNSGHVAAALRMMASWDLTILERELPRLETPLHLIVGTRDKTISPDQAFAVRSLVPHAEVKRLAGLGHLAHEEAPQAFADHILALEEAPRARAGA